MKKNYSSVSTCSVCQSYFKSKPKGWSNLYCSKPCSITGSHDKLKIAAEKLKNIKEHEYSLNPRSCRQCNKPLNYLSTKTNKFCSKSCGAKYNNHQRKLSGWTHSPKTRILLSEFAKNHPTGFVINPVSRKGTKTAVYISKICPTCNSNFDTREKDNKVFCSKICIRTGGMREGSGRAKTGWYKGIYCGSTYELAFLIYNLDHNKNIKRYNGYFQYIWEGKNKKYYPDFIIDDAIYEIKGMIQPVDFVKIKTANATLVDKDAMSKNKRL